MRIVLGILLFCGTASLWAQSKEHLHTSHPRAEEHQVHAAGKKSDLPLWKKYAPPENITGEHEMDQSFWWATWATIICFSVLIFFLAYSIWRYRERPGRNAFYTDGKAQKKYTLVVDVLFFVLVDCFLIYFSVRDVKQFFYADKAPTGPDVVRIQVMPQQWVWNFRYPGSDGEFGTPDDIVTVNEMRVPSNRDISLQIKSKDVIHGFMIPEARRQIDAIPGTVTRIWFNPKKNGDYEIACMHLCGTSHYKMKAFLKVMDDNYYQDWRKEQSVWAKTKYDPNNKKLHWGWQWGIN